MIEKDNNGAISASLIYRKGELNGRCSFYNCGTLKETTECVNYVKEGWSWGYDYQGNVVRKILYENGKKKGTLEI